MFVHPITEAQFNYQMRVQGGFLPTEFSPASKDTYYRDQSYDLTNLKSIPYNVQRLTIGDGGGVPNYIADIINRIFACSYLSIDDVAFVKSDGSKFERKGAELIGKAAWKIEVEEAVNVDSYTSIWLQQVQVTTATVTDNAVALIEAGYELENGYVLQLGDIVAVLEQTTKSDNGIYVVGETVAELTHHEKYPTDVSCDKVIALLDFPDKYDNYIYALYYDYSKSELMAVTYLKYATEDKAAFVMTGETKEIIFGSTLYGVPTIINITLWDATGQPVVGGYTVTSVTVNGMTIVCNGNDEELTGNYYVKC